jgi:3',5'-cyclic AMP phosphodiesterase CpdA
MSRFRLAHLSDPHLGPLPRPPLGSLLSKRIFGYVNWQRNRRHALGDEVLAAIVEDVSRQAVDHVCVTGDLVNIALPEEFANAAVWLSTLGAPHDVSVVPGNHDAYVPGAARRAAEAWIAHASESGSQGFPFARKRNGVLLVGVSSAVATLPLYASGRVGEAQRARLAALLDRHDDAFKVVLIHHPPDTALSRGRRGLTDAPQVREVLAAGCAQLVLHGHTHRPSLTYLDTARGRAAVIGVPSASSDGSRHPLGGYALLDIDTARGTARLRRRAPEGAGKPMVTVETIDLEFDGGSVP